MEITREEEHNIVEMVVSMFNAASGAKYLALLKSLYFDLGSMDKLQDWLTDLTLYQNRFSDDIGITADVLLDSYGLSTGTTAGDTAKEYFVHQLNTGTSISNLNKMALDYLKSDNRNIMFDEAAAIFKNKVEAAMYYSVDKALGKDDKSLSELQSTIALVTADVASVETVSNTNYAIATLDSQKAWDEEIITFSFNTYIPSDYYEYNEYIGYSQLTDNWTALNIKQTDAVRSITNQINEFLGVTLEEVSSGGMIQFNIVNMTKLQDGDRIDDPSTSGFAFMPQYQSEYDGDVFLSSNFNTTEDYSLAIGEAGWSTIAHELGHALGLKHPFEGDYQLIDGVDNDTRHSIMSYDDVNSYIPILSYTSKGIAMDYPQIHHNLYAIYDIATLQSIYGVNSTTNTANNTYTISYQDYELQTIWDAGGIDTIDLSDTNGSSTIDLRSGSLNSADQHSLEEIIAIHHDDLATHGKSQHNDTVAEWITELYNSGNLYQGSNNLAIASGVIIENLTTGDGDDIVTDNQYNNIIYTNKGDDKIYITNGGADYVYGGDGEDIVYFDFSFDDIDISTYYDGHIVTLDNSEIKLFNIEEFHFTNFILYSDDVLI